MAARPVARLIVAGAFASVLWSSDAHADASSWLYFGGGGVGWQGQDQDLKFSPTMAIDLGVGTDDRAPFIFGGLFRIQPVFEHGADLGLAGRFATRGFQSGPFGFAVDLGGYQRFWGAGSTGFWGQASLGGPLGFQLSLLGAGGSSDAFAFGASAGIDLARLIVYRETLLDWWPNPRPERRIGARELPALLHW